MVVFFGPAGAGKSIQGQIMAARHGWRWLSAGQLLRDMNNQELLNKMSTGALVDADIVNKVMTDAIARSKDIDHVVIDGYPRQLSQAKWLIDKQPEHQRSISLVIVLEVPMSELLRRLEIRGRSDDKREVIEERMNIYRQEMYPILTYLTEQKVHIVHIDGTGTVGQVHDRIEAELEACSLV